MEDIIGKYLYIIIFVGIIVINILRSLKKQQPVPVPEHAEPEESEGGDFWNQSPPPQQQPAFQVQQVQSRPKNVETIFPKNVKKENSHLMLTEEHNNPISVEFNDRDDARRAFIYSEIWNRKY